MVGKVRAEAEVELERYGELLLADLQAAVQRENTLEKKRRLERLLEKAQNAALPFQGTQRLGQLRALEVLEKIGTPDARKLVRDLANGAEEGQLTAAARTVLARLEARARRKD